MVGDRWMVGWGPVPSKGRGPTLPQTAGEVHGVRDGPLPLTFFLRWP